MKKSAERIVDPELLDELPPQDRRAVRSRLDLRRLNQWMRHPRHMTSALANNLAGIKVPRLVELGAGDGHFLLSIARRLKSHWPRADATIVDRLNAFDSKTHEGFKEAGWPVRAEVVEVFEWLRQTSPGAADAIICNLFLHHFQAEDLAKMFRLIARSTHLFVALEPRRSWFPAMCGHLLWCIGCGPVTRHDAVVSIRAGFSGRELSALWPDKREWELDERPAGLFSHLFVARQKG